MNKRKVIGLMSGTSLDGLDIAYIEFNFDNSINGSPFKIIQTKSVSYSDEFIQELKQATQLSTRDFLILDKKIGAVFGKAVNDFITEFNIDLSEIDAIASHGQTTFHQPENGFTSQIGCGDTIAVLTGVPVINDFRTKDVILGGQGAPLVPIGDFNLFQNEAVSFLNLGGIANISFKKNNEIIAFDISPANHPLNKIVERDYSELNINYDKGGQIARSGKVDKFLLEQLNNLVFYNQAFPKSLGTEWLDACFYKITDQLTIPSEDQLRTIIEHEAIQIAAVLNDNKLNSVFISGGGALNDFMIERLKHHYLGKVIIPEKQIIEFKEAIVFAYLGALYLNKQTNILKSVTGASRDSIGGVLHLP